MANIDKNSINKLEQSIKELTDSISLFSESSIISTFGKGFNNIASIAKSLSDAQNALLKAEEKKNKDFEELNKRKEEEAKQLEKYRVDNEKKIKKLLNKVSAESYLKYYKSIFKTAKTIEDAEESIEDLKREIDPQKYYKEAAKKTGWKGRGSRGRSASELWNEYKKWSGEGFFKEKGIMGNVIGALSSGAWWGHLGHKVINPFIGVGSIGKALINPFWQAGRFSVKATKGIASSIYRGGQGIYNWVKNRFYGPTPTEPSSPDEGTKEALVSPVSEIAKTMLGLGEETKTESSEKNTTEANAIEFATEKEEADRKYYRNSVLEKLDKIIELLGGELKDLKAKNGKLSNSGSSSGGSLWDFLKEMLLTMTGMKALKTFLKSKFFKGAATKNPRETLKETLNKRRLATERVKLAEDRISRLSKKVKVAENNYNAAKSLKAEALEKYKARQFEYWNKKNAKSFTAMENAAKELQEANKLAKSSHKELSGIKKAINNEYAEIAKGNKNIKIYAKDASKLMRNMRPDVKTPFKVPKFAKGMKGGGLLAVALEGIDTFSEYTSAENQYDKDTAIQAAAARTTTGLIAGALASAATQAAIGTAIGGPVGTLIGAISGLITGGVAYYMASSSADKAVRESRQNSKPFHLMNEEERSNYGKERINLLNAEIDKQLYTRKELWVIPGYGGAATYYEVDKVIPENERNEWKFNPHRKGRGGKKTWEEEKKFWERNKEKNKIFREFLEKNPELVGSKELQERVDSDKYLKDTYNKFKKDKKNEAINDYYSSFTVDEMGNVIWLPKKDDTNKVSEKNTAEGELSQSQNDLKTPPNPDKTSSTALNNEHLSNSINNLSTVVASNNIEANRISKENATAIINALNNKTFNVQTIVSDKHNLAMGAALDRAWT